ncbi:MAG: MFS transporter [Desulfomonilaceae bacterium]
MATDTRGYRALVGSSVAIFWPGAFIFGFPGVMAPYWSRSFGVGHGPVGTIMFFVLAAVGIFMFFVGKWLNRLGSKNLVSIGALLCGANVFTLLIANSIWWIYVWAFINGAASCFVLLPTLTCVQQWFPQKRGLVSGIVNLMFGLSAAIMAPLFGILIERFGYLGVIEILGPVSLLTGLVAAQFTGPPVNVPVSTGSASKIANSLPKTETMTTSEIIGSRNFLVLWIIWAFQGAAGISMVTLSTGYGMARGYPLESAVIMLTVFNLASGLSRLISGYLSDKIGRTFMLCAGTTNNENTV